MQEYDGPVCFAIPGNHDWLDGLECFLRYICCRDWMGGWLLPQVRVVRHIWQPSFGLLTVTCMFVCAAGG